MKKTRLLLLAVVSTLALAACTDDPPADKIAGSFNCNAVLYTRFQRGGEWHDTTYVHRTNNRVVLSKVDDNTVSVNITSNKYGSITADVATVSDFNYSGNFSGNATYNSPNGTFDVKVSGTVTYDPRGITASIRVPGYPSSGGKYVLTFTTSDTW